jgi:integrase
MDLSAANHRLREAGIKVTLLQRKKWLYLRTVLPPKPGSGKSKPFRQEITRPKAGLPATPKGLREAEKLAISLWGSLLDGTFDWDTWLGKTSREHRTVKEWVAQFREKWMSQGKTSQATWDRHWQRAYNRLPQDKPLTHEILLGTLLSINPGTRERKRTTGYFQRLAEFAELSIDLSSYKGEYSTGRSEVPRALPTDETIAEWWKKIPNPHWQWVYGVIAALGVRPHEAFFLQGTADPFIWNVTDGKTGPRQASALYPEWVTQWNLIEGSPPDLSYSEFQAYGSQVVHQFNRYGLPFVPYDLRHAFAVRCIKFEIPVSIAARMMGHSVAVHTKTYHRWLSAAEQKAAYHRAISNGPKAPSVSGVGV